MLAAELTVTVPTSKFNLGDTITWSYGTNDEVFYYGIVVERCFRQSDDYLAWEYAIKYSLENCNFPDMENFYNDREDYVTERELLEANAVRVY